MGMLRKSLSAVLVALLGVWLWMSYGSHFQPPPRPVPDETAWWGPGTSRDSPRTVVPFKISVSKEDLQDLNDRLTRFLQKPHKPPLENQGFQYGFNSNYLKQVVTYWRNDYSWKKREAYLNQYPQFKTKLAGLDIHFLRVRPEQAGGKRVLPLLLLHGWPGSVREFYEVIPLLTTPRSNADFVFEVVVPSLPGYGFSDGAARPGLTPDKIAVIMKALMTRLNFDRFYVSGGDWGSLVAKHMGQLYPEKVLGLHSTMCFVSTPLSNLKWALGSLYPPMMVEDRFKSKMYPISNVVSGLVKEMGYFLIQSTKPDTIGNALSDTPAGLASYILEKFSTWTNKAWKNRPDGGVTEKYSMDSLLDNVMIYWVTNSITTSQRLYAEAMGAINPDLERAEVTVPTACARPEHEILWQPKSILQEVFVNLVQVTDLEDVGHFSAFENPKVFNEDLWSAVKSFELHYKKLASESSPPPPSSSPSSSSSKSKKPEKTR